MASCSMLEKKEGEGVSTIIIGPNWLELPRDVTANILQRLGVVEIVTSACQVCPLQRPSHAEDISIGSFGTNYLLTLIADR
ncbi:F-box/LRR protein [Sesbania bispinosa]|nr:F-box/LRR protein [Sesbania bispinosa]